MTVVFGNLKPLMRHLCSSAVLSAIVLLPVCTGVAVAQEQDLRSTIEPESVLAQSPLRKIKRKLPPRGLNTSALTPTTQLSNQTESDEEAEALLQLLGEDQGIEDGEQPDPNDPDAKPRRKANSLSEIEPADDEGLDGASNTTTKKTGTKKPATKTLASGKTVIDPGLDEQTTGTLVVRKGQKAAMLRAQPSIAAEAVQSRDLTEEENPFQAVGIRFGSIILRPAIEQGIEATTNGTGSAGGGSAVNSVTTFRVDGVSDWRNGKLETAGFLTLRNSLSGEGNEDPEAGGSFKLTQPILRDWSYTLGGAYGLKRESAVSASAFPATITERPLAQDIRLSLGVGKDSGIFQPSAKVEYGRTTYGDATDSLGTIVSQSDRDQTSLRGTLRLGAELSPALTPFVEVAYGKTWRDEEIDAFGNNRSSTDLRASIGTELNLSEKLNGEISVGWLRQTFDNASLDNIDGVALAAALNWSPAQGTTISAGLTTNAEPSNSATISGSIVYGATLGITHQLSSRLSTSANLGASYRDFTGAGGSDTTLSAELAATYMVNRMLGVNAKAKYETVSSSDPTRESDTTTLLLGMKIQR